MSAVEVCRMRFLPRRPQRGDAVVAESDLFTKT